MRTVFDSGIKDMRDHWLETLLRGSQKAPERPETGPERAQAVGVHVRFQNASYAIVGDVTHQGSLEKLLEVLSRIVVDGGHLNTIMTSLVRNYNCQVGLDAAVKVNHNLLVKKNNEDKFTVALYDNSNRLLLEGSAEAVLNEVRLKALEHRGISKKHVGWVVQFDYKGGSHPGKRIVYVNEILQDAGKTYITGRDLYHAFVEDDVNGGYRKYLVESIIGDVVPVLKIT